MTVELMGWSNAETLELVKLPRCNRQANKVYKEALYEAKYDCMAHSSDSRIKDVQYIFSFFARKFYVQSDFIKNVNCNEIAEAMQ